MTIKTVQLSEEDLNVLVPPKDTTTSNEEATAPYCCICKKTIQIGDFIVFELDHPTSRCICKACLNTLHNRA